MITLGWAEACRESTWELNLELLYVSLEKALINIGGEYLATKQNCLSVLESAFVLFAWVVLEGNQLLVCVCSGGVFLGI